MKKKIFKLLAMVFTLLMVVGCSQEKDKSEIESLVGYIYIENNILYVDEVEIVTLDDIDRIEELDLTIQNDLPSGYSIYNSNIEKEAYDLTDETVYKFVDMNLLFVDDEDGDRIYTTIKIDEFLKHLDEYNLNDIPLSQQKIPYFIEVQNGKIIKIEEKFEYTI